MRIRLTILLALSVLGIHQGASLSGRVVDDRGRPVRLAVVTVSGGSLSHEIATVSGDDGTFVFPRLPAGLVTLSAAKKAYVTNAYGARRPGRRGTPLRLTDGETRADVTVTLPRGAVITGTLRGAAGEPLPGIEVTATEAAMADLDSRVTIAPAATSTTDDRGVYRLFGLPPGDYVVTATLRLTGATEVGVRSTAAIDAEFDRLRQGRGARPPFAASETASPQPSGGSFGFAPTWFPGTPSIEHATHIRLVPGDERAGVDFPLSLVSLSRVEGVVVTADGSPLPPLRASMQLAGASAVASLMAGPSGGQVDAAGRFEFRGVPPGTHTVTVSTTAGRGTAAGRGGAAEPPVQFARSRVTVDGDVGRLALTLRPGLAIGGRVVFEGTSIAPPADLTQVRVTVLAESVRAAIGASLRTTGAARILGPTGIVGASLDAGGTFVVRNLMPDRYGVTPSIAPGTGWWLRSAMTGGRDILDYGLDLETDVTDVVFTYTDRRSQLTGRLETAGGQPASEYFIVVLPADRSYWLPGARRIRSTRPDSAGVFTVLDLPAGEYLLAAVTDVEPEDLGRVAFLKAAAAQAVPVVIKDGEKTEQHLRIAG